MLIAILMIVYRGEELLTLHNDKAAAWDALIRFVDARWNDHLIGVPVPMEEEERVQRFFRTGNDLYIIADADLSELEGALGFEPE